MKPGYVYLKEGEAPVDFNEIHHSMISALSSVCQVFCVYNSPCVVTSAQDGVHKESSKHYEGKALDFRIWYVSNPSEVAEMIRLRLGKHYDVVLESTHIHVELDPKGDRPRD